MKRETSTLPSEVIEAIQQAGCYFKREQDGSPSAVIHMLGKMFHAWSVDEFIDSQWPYLSPSQKIRARNWLLSIVQAWSKERSARMEHINSLSASEEQPKRFKLIGNSLRRAVESISRLPDEVEDAIAGAVFHFRPGNEPDETRIIIQLPSGSFYDHEIDDAILKRWPELNEAQVKKARKRFYQAGVAACKQHAQSLRSGGGNFVLR